MDVLIKQLAELPSENNYVRIPTKLRDRLVELMTRQEQPQRRTTTNAGKAVSQTKQKPKQRTQSA